MKIVKGLYGSKTTFFIDKYIINGCQCFTIDELDRVCGRFDIGDSVKELVKSHYYEYQKSISSIGENWELVLKQTSLYSNVQLHLIEHVKNEELHKLLTLSDSWYIRRQLAVHTPYINIVQMLKLDPLSRVRFAAFNRVI